MRGTRISPLTLLVSMQKTDLEMKLLIVAVLAVCIVSTVATPLRQKDGMIDTALSKPPNS